MNNAGLMPLSTLDQLKVDEWEQMVDVNIKGVLCGIAAALPLFKKQDGGRFINISSVAGHQIFPGAAVCCATKFAVRVISEALRSESIPTIRTTDISPGAMATELPSTITDSTAERIGSLQDRAAIRNDRPRHRPMTASWVSPTSNED